jgi:predicted transposase YdaD
VLDALQRWRDLIEAVWKDEGPPNPAAILEALGWYVLKVSDVTQEQLPSELKQPQADEHGERMTTAERIVREARNQGRMEGRVEGQREGQRDAACRTLLRQVERRFGAVPAAVRARIESSSTTQLEAWLDRIFDLRSPEDLLTPE